MSRFSAALRKQVSERANNCCEYCLLSQEDTPFPYHLEHIISEKHSGQTNLDNLAFSCPDCNRNKGSDIASNDPMTGDLARLYNPRFQNWDEHFRLNFDTAKIEALSPEGRVTVFILKMNSKEQVEYRKIVMELESYPCTGGEA